MSRQKDVRRKIEKKNTAKFSPAFNRLWSSSAASNVVDGLLKSAAPLLATTLTKDPFWISTIAALVMVPWLLFAIPIGGLVDRIHRRTMLAIANSIRLGAMVLLAVSVGLGFITLPILLLATFLFGVGEVIYDTTMQSMLPEVLETNQLEKGNARLQITSVTLGEFIGTPLGAFLFALSIALPFFFGALGILIAIGLVLFIPTDYSLRVSSAETKEPTKFWADVRFGIKYLYESKRLLRLVLMTSAMGFFYAVSSSTMVLFIIETLKTPPALLGVIIATPAIGALLGSVTAHRFSAKFGRMRVMAWAMVLSAVVTVLHGLSPNYWILALIMTISSLIVTHWNILLMATYHQIIPSHLFGRIHGTRRTLVWGLLPIGSLVGGVIATIDLRLPFIVGGLFCLVISVIGYRFINGLSDMLVSEESAKS